MSRIIRKPVTLFSVAFVVILSLVAWKVGLLSSASAAPQQGSSSDLAVNLIRAGLDPEALTAAGVTSGQVATLVGQVQAAIVAEPQQLAVADANYGAARVAVDALQRKIQSGLATQQEVADYPTAVQTLATATADRQTALTALFSAGTQGLQPAVVTKLQTIRANRAWQLPIEFLVADRSEVEWVALRDALSNERITAKYDDPADPALATQLAAWRAAPDVAFAKTSLDSNLSGVKAAWNNAAG